MFLQSFVLQYRPHGLSFEHGGFDNDVKLLIQYGLAPQHLIGGINGFVLGTLDTGQQWVNLRSSDQKLLPAQKIFAFPYIFCIYINAAVKTDINRRVYFGVKVLVFCVCKTWGHQTWSVDASCWEVWSKWHVSHFGFQF